MYHSILSRNFLTRPQDLYQSSRHHFQVTGMDNREQSHVPSNPELWPYNSCPSPLPLCSKKGLLVISYIIHVNVCCVLDLLSNSSLFQQIHQLIPGLQLLYVSVHFIKSKFSQYLRMEKLWLFRICVPFVPIVKGKFSAINVTSYSRNKVHMAHNLILVQNPQSSRNQQPLKNFSTFIIPSPYQKMEFIILQV